MTKTGQFIYGTLFTAASTVAAFAGIAILSGPGGKATPLGVFYVMLSALSYAAYMILYNRRRPQTGAFQTSLFTAFFCMAAIAALAVLSGHYSQPLAPPAAIGHKEVVALD